MPISLTMQEALNKMQNGRSYHLRILGAGISTLEAMERRGLVVGGEDNNRPDLNAVWFNIYQVTSKGLSCQSPT